MTADEVHRIFAAGKLRIGDNYYWFDGKGNYTLAKGKDSVYGTYEFIPEGNKIYLRTNPSIIEGKQNLEVTLCLDTLPVLFETE